MAQPQHAQASAPSLSMRMVTFGIRKKFPSVRNINSEQLEQWRAEGMENLVCLDTRSEEEYAVSHLPGAIQVDPEGQHSLESLKINPSSTVVCYCSVGYRSSALVQKLSQSAKSKGQAGELQVYNLEGGIFQWACDGREMVDNAGTAAVVHPYAAFWGNLLPSKLRASL